MRLLSFCILCVGSIIVIPTLVMGASSDFTIRTFVGNDNTPPTTPNLLLAIPVASTQINITWSASTDDVALAGYRVFRDAVQIATTTLLSYSDTGLTASTTYSYTVDAFDTFNNFSSTSLSLATTTPDNPPPVATSTASSSSNDGGTRTKPILSNLAITTTQTSALFSWETKAQTKYTLVWGRTTAYELGSVSGVTYSQNHLTNIDSLEPGTTYYYELRATSPSGLTEVLSRDTFSTKSIVPVGTIANVQSFSAVAQNEDVELSWQNTFTNPNYFVRIVRSHLFYPSGIQSGAVVYEGRGQSFSDSNALVDRSPQFYTIFVLDGTGSFSSGAIARVFKQTAPGTSQPENIAPTSTIPVDIGDDTILRARDISVIQNDLSNMFDEELTLDKNLPFIISVPYTAVPKNLKSIIVTVQNPTNQRESSAYLLKLNQAGDAYIASIPGANAVGTIRMMVEVFDYEQATVRRISTTVTFVDAAATVPFFPDRLMVYLEQFLAVLVLVVACFWFIVMWRRRKKTAS